MNDNPVFNFDRSLVKDFRIFAQIMAPIIQVVYVAQVDAYCLMDQGGYIYTSEETNKLTKELAKFHEAVSNESLTDFNSRENTPQIKSAPKVKHASKVYLISKPNGHCKIGISTHPKSRLSNIKSVEPQAELIHSFDADNALEAEKILHQTYKDKNVGGEWFGLFQNDISDIQSISGYKNGTFLRGE